MGLPLNRMRYFLGVLMSIAAPCQASVCGLYQTEDFGERVLYTLTRFSGAGNGKVKQTVFTITNPANQTVRGMVRGACYCADGIVQQDPEFDGDLSYQLFTLVQLIGPPYAGCIP